MKTMKCNYVASASIAACGEVDVISAVFIAYNEKTNLLLIRSNLTCFEIY